MELQGVADLFGNVVDVRLVVLRQDDVSDARPVARALLLDAADGQDTPAEGSASECLTPVAQCMSWLMFLPPP